MPANRFPIRMSRGAALGLAMLLACIGMAVQPWQQFDQADPGRNLFLLIHGGGPRWIVQMKGLERDLRGRGVSTDHIIQPRYGYRDGLEVIHRDLVRQLQRVVRPQDQLYVWAHSLGDFVGLRALLDGGYGSQIKFYAALGGVAHGQNRSPRRCNWGPCLPYFRKLAPLNNPFIQSVWAPHAETIAQLHHCAVYSRRDRRVNDPRDSGAFASSKVAVHNDFSHMDLVKHKDAFEFIAQACDLEF